MASYREDRTVPDLDGSLANDDGLKRKTKIPSAAATSNPLDDLIEESAGIRLSGNADGQQKQDQSFPARIRQTSSTVSNERHLWRSSVTHHLREPLRIFNRPGIKQAKSSSMQMRMIICARWEAKKSCTSTLLLPQLGL
ncbi:hypothetical protein O181_030866 [Austropuccinia psidii MF-1]|uniref:Uncharacterized protein n=1 Tax=Austropuccinia psidii MF-1 TaxID=1389203 RepID=A0A9Q3CZB8_9BASI|nr:hypothetical protein [Austropuccinia psidii MF-1]